MSTRFLAMLTVTLMVNGFSHAVSGERTALQMRQDPLTRYIHVSYQVPANAPDQVTVLCSWSPTGKNEWRSAKVMPYVSETALRLVSGDKWKQWASEGRITERRAAGLERKVIFNPYLEAQENGRVECDFRVEIRDADKALSTDVAHLRADNSDVVYLHDWSKVLQKEAVAAGPEPGEAKWLLDDGLQAKSGTAFPLLTYPLDLSGWYAIFVCTCPGEGSIGLRLSGDERTDKLSSPREHEEVFWRWSRMDHQHMVLSQPYSWTGPGAASVMYVKLVPLSEKLLDDLEARFEGRRDKTVAGYFEPYSWAFYANVQSNLQHREPLTAFVEGGVDIVDVQVGRFGAKVVYESRLTDQLLHGTYGDPISGVVPETGNVGRMQQYTNTLETELKYARELGLVPHANFGATNCYIGSPLQGDFSKEHPDWVRGHALRYEAPEVRAYILGLYREALEIGAPGISIDFCRYPEGIDKAETCTAFLRELRRLADEFERTSGKHVPVLIRFPATGVRLWERFDYRTWITEGLVDYLCPSNIQGRHLHFDIRPYANAVKGTKCKLLPVVDGLGWGLDMPGVFLWRVKQLYDVGVDGIYVYQADSRVLGRPGDRRCMRLLGSSGAVTRWWAEDTRERPGRSKGIYVTPPTEMGVYNKWERLRVWLEGIEMGPVEMYLDGKLISRYDAPPYILGTEEYESDTVIPPGQHALRVRARDGDGWLEQEFAITGAE